MHFDAGSTDATAIKVAVERAGDEVAATEDGRGSASPWAEDAIPLAALGLLHAMVGVIALPASSLTVVGSSLLPRHTKLEVDRP